MNRMTNEHKSTPEAYNKIFDKLRILGDDFFDFTFDKRHKTLLKHFKGGKLLDVGCLNSPLCLIAQKQYPTAEITLLDFAPHVINYFYNNYLYETVLSDCCHTPFQDNTFDYITAGELIEHQDEPKDLVKEMARILKPNGIFALSTPDREANNERGAGYHIWSFKEEDIKEFLEPYGEVKTEILEKSQNVNYIIGFLTKVGGKR